MRVPLSDGSARIAGGAVGNYALTPDGWRSILAWQDRVHG